MDQRRRVELLGRRLRRLRKERRWSHGQLAERAGIEAQDLARIERGEIRLGVEALFRLLTAFELGPAEIRELMAARRGERGERFRRELSS